MQYCGETDEVTGFVKGCFYESKLSDVIEYVTVTLDASSVGMYYILDDEGNYNSITLTGEGTGFDPTITYYKKQEVSVYIWSYIDSLVVDKTLDLQSQRAISNGAVTAKFNEMQEAIDTTLEGYTENATELLQSEYDILTDEEKLANNYHCTDTGRMYYNGVLYGEKKAIELTYDEYKALEEAGEVEADVNYIVVPNENGTLLEATDVAYSNTLSGLEATNVQGAVDKVNDKVDGLVDNENVSADTTWSSSKIESEIAQRFPTLSVRYANTLKVTRNSTTSAFIKFMDVHGNLYTLQCGDQADRFYVIPSYIGVNLSTDITTFAKDTSACYLYSNSYYMHVLEVVGDVSYSVIDKTAIPSTATTVNITT